MLNGAARGESAGNGEEDDFLVGPFCVCLLSVWLLQKVQDGGVIKGKVQGVSRGDGEEGTGNWNDIGGERPLEAL